MSRDPIEYRGGENLYAYVGGRPVGWVDPDGHSGEVIQLTSGLGEMGLSSVTPAVVASGVVAGGFTIYCIFNPDECKAAWEGFQDSCGADNSTLMESRIKGERGRTGGVSGRGTSNPLKHCRPHPTKPGYLECKDPHTGKKYTIRAPA